MWTGFTQPRRTILSDSDVRTSRDLLVKRWRARANFSLLIFIEFDSLGYHPNFNFEKWCHVWFRLGMMFNTLSECFIPVVSEHQNFRIWNLKNNLSYRWTFSVIDPSELTFHKMRFIAFCRKQWCWWLYSDNNFVTNTNICHHHRFSPISRQNPWDCLCPPDSDKNSRYFWRFFLIFLTRLSN